MKEIAEAIEGLISSFEKQAGNIEDDGVLGQALGAIDLARKLAPVVVAKLEAKNIVRGMTVNVPGTFLKEHCVGIAELEQFIRDDAVYAVNLCELHDWISVIQRSKAKS